MQMLTCTHLQVLWHHRNSVTDRCTHFSIEWGLGGSVWMPACKFVQTYRICQILPNLCELVQFYANLAFGIIPLWLLAQEEGQMYANLHRRLSRSCNFIQSLGNWTSLCKSMQTTSNDVIGLTTWNTGPLMLGRQSLAACKSKPTLRDLWKFMQICTNLRLIFELFYASVLYDVSPTANTCKIANIVRVYADSWTFAKSVPFM